MQGTRRSHGVIPHPVRFLMVAVGAVDVIAQFNVPWREGFLLARRYRQVSGAPVDTVFRWYETSIDAPVDEGEHQIIQDDATDIATFPLGATWSAIRDRFPYCSQYNPTDTDFVTIVGGTDVLAQVGSTRESVQGNITVKMTTSATTTYEVTGWFVGHDA